MYNQFMIRTQMYLDEDIHKNLVVLAMQEKVSMAKLTRDFLKEGIQRKKTRDISGKGVVQKLLAIKATGGPRDLSQNVDHYLYGSPKKHA